jgi:dTDP-4-dehydrorhamnose reductase
MMINENEILMTGGHGRLGTEIRRLMPEIITPDLPDFDITDAASINAAFRIYKPKLIIHAAAYTNVAEAERNKSICWAVNVDGTRNLIKIVKDYAAYLIHISTDYVFWGDSGMYREDDPLGPVRNYYSLTKLVAEAITRICEDHLVIRTSFRPREWPYETAFTDMYTSQDYVDIIAPEIVLAIRNFNRIPYDTIHIATERKSIFDLARRRKPAVHPGLREDAGVNLPYDISLDISRWTELKKEWATNEDQ